MKELPHLLLVNEMSGLSPTMTTTINLNYTKWCVFTGVADSPLMTWGEIESTPFRLDGSESPYIERNHGPSFKVLHVPPFGIIRGFLAIFYFC